MIKPKCIICKTELKGRQITICSQTCRGRMRRIRNKKFINDYKKNKSCVKCGYKTNLKILVFHHNKGKKYKILNEMRMKSLKKIEAEIKKCVLLCPNCHAIEHLPKIEE